MGERIQIPLPKQTNRPLATRQSIERLVNMRAHLIEGRSQYVLEQRPGLRLVSTVGSGPIRGIFAFAGALYVVSGLRLYVVSPLSGVPREIGVIDGAGPVEMAANRTHFVICTNGPAYYSDGSNVAALPESKLTRVTYQDGYLVYAQSGTENVFISGLDDATTISALDFTTTDAFTDNIMAVVSVYREVWAVGETSIEILANVGDASFPFVRTPQGFIERGTPAPRSVQKVGRRLVFLGDDSAVYASSGYNIEPISTPGIEEAIKSAGSPSGSEAFVYTEGGRSFYVLTINDLTISFNFRSGLWNEESSDPNSNGRWKIRGAAKVARTWYTGSTEDGRVFALDDSVYDDAGSPLVREIVTAPVAGIGDQPIYISELCLDCEAGVGLDGDAQGSEPKLMMDHTDDGGKTWANERWADLGKIGRYNQKPKFTRLGRASNRSIRFRVSDPVKWAVNGLYARAEVGL